MPSKAGAGGAGAGGFIGFSAFADPSSTIAGAVAAAGSSNAGSTTDGNAGSTSTRSGNAARARTAAATMGPTPSPVFAGSDPHLHQLFRRIGQKKDATTRVRALDELTGYAFGGGTAASDGIGSSSDNGGGASARTATASGHNSNCNPNLSRQDKVAALSHLTYLALTKLLWDNAPSVRAATLSTLTAASGAVPKAWRGLVLYGAPRLKLVQDNQVGVRARPNADAMLVLPEGGLSSSGLTVAALVYTLAGDPSSEVAAAADSFLGRLLLEEKEKDAKDIDNNKTNAISNNKALLQCSVVNFALAALQLGGADALDGAIFGTGTGTGGSNTNMDAKARGKGSKKQRQQKYHNAGRGGGGCERSDAQREESEERYERTVLAILGALSMLVKSFPEPSSSWSRSEQDGDAPAATTTVTRFAYADLIVQEERKEGQGDSADGGGGDDNAGDVERERSSFWRHLTSSRSPFRRATYATLSDLCQGSPSLLHGGGSRTIKRNEKNKKSLSNQLPTAIANEHDPGNVPKMLSFVLSYVASSRKMIDADNQSSPGTSILWDVDKGGIDGTKLVSALSKLFRRGCHGSPAIGWAPIVLPIVACLPRLEGKNALQRKIMAALWEGRSAAIGGGANDAAIVTAVEEVSTYLLLRKMEDSAVEDGDDEAKDISQYIFRSLQYYLCESDGGNSRDGSSSANELCAALCRDLQRIDSASERVDCILHPVRDWFWADGVGKIILDAVGKKDNVLSVTRLGDLVNVANATANNGLGAQSSGHHLAPILRDSVNIVDPSGSSSSDGPPIYANIKLLLEGMRYCGIFSVLKVSGDHDDEAVASCISSQIVPWIIATFSSSSSLSMSSASSYRAAYIELMCLCLDAIISNDHRREAWSAALDKMVRAHVDLSFLADLIAEVQTPTRTSASIVRCDALDDFATQVGEAASLLFQEKALSEQMVNSDESRSMRHLLHTLVGLSSKCSQMLVGQGVIQSWIEFACPESKSEKEDLPLLIKDVGCNDILLDVLLTMVSQGDPFVTGPDVLRIMIQSFREGGQIWEGKALQLPETHRQYQHLVKDLEERAKVVLKQDLETISRLQKRPDVDRVCRIWSERCTRLFELCSDPNLDLVGLDNVDLWAASYSTLTPSTLFSTVDGDVDIDLCAQINPLFTCLKLVLQNFEPVKRREMLCGSLGTLDATGTELILHVLLSLSHAVPSQVPTPTASRQYLCHDLFDLLRDLPRPYLLDLCKQTIALISREMSQADGDENSREVTNRAVVALDVLAEKAFGRRSLSEGTCAEDDEVSQDNIREGDKLYYVAKGEDGSATTRAQCQVAKIHTDDYPNLYFTIRIEGENGVTSERQTVANRLRKLAKAQSSKSEQPQTGESDGTDMTALLFDRVIKPYLGESVTRPSSFVTEAAAECCSIAISKFGLGDKSGIGTIRYEVYQIVSSLEQSARNTLINAAGQVEVAATSLRCLALALGYGALTEFSPTNTEALKLSPADLVGSIHDAIDSATKTKQSIVSTLMWLSVALSSSSTNGDVFRQTMYILEVASQKLSRQLDSQDDLVLLLRSFSTVQKHAHGCIDYSSSDTKSEKEILGVLVRIFVATSVDDEEDADGESPLWLDLFSSLVKYNLTRDGGDGRVLLYGAREWNEALCDTLFSSWKRQCGYQLLSTIASEQIMFNPSGQISLETRQHLKKWKANLDSEEAEELQDDATVSCKWLPECLMNLVGDWSEMSDEDRSAEDEDESIGKLLSWLACLNFLDNAAAVDIRNRNAITSYFDQAGAVAEVLATATRHANLTDSKAAAWMSCLDTMNGQDDPLTLSDVATLTVFRTIESVPTLAKKWYLDFCPRSIAPQMNAFVEKRVAPETLMRELSRIKNVESSFGDMSVTGSYVSRIITATYVQDESTLSVQISVPPSFPLRNAEVDCKMTLGIPNQRWRRWELMITRMLNHEDGSILDALLLWKKNCDKEFDGVEPCPVCYSVLCVKTHAMPNLECKTCNNRFHSNCLMKWFKTSGKNLCVMCQQSWSGTKIS